MALTSPTRGGRSVDIVRLVTKATVFFMQPVSKQLIDKHASTTKELVLETMFSARSVRSDSKEENWENQLN
jgi:hypothetical protein